MGDMADLSTVFEFEKDFQQTLHCVPMAVRMKLDLSGVKLKLKEWLKLSEAERNEFLLMACNAPAEEEAFRARMTGLVKERTGETPELMPPPVRPPWEDAEHVPAPLAEKARSEGFSISPQAWADLSPLQRFALVKLSRPGHENKNFLPAAREFGLLP